MNPKKVMEFMAKRPTIWSYGGYLGSDFDKIQRFYTLNENAEALQRWIVEFEKYLGIKPR